MNYSKEINMLIEKIMEDHIIQSVIGDDFYKNTMGLFISHHGYNNIRTVWKFSNRTKNVALSYYLDENKIQDEYSHFRNLKLQTSEEDYLRSIPNFGNKPGIDAYINILKNQTVPEVNVCLLDEQPDISWGGGPDWISQSRLEIPTLQIMIGLYYRQLLSRISKKERKEIFKTGLKKLLKDIALLKKNPTTKIVNFGNRRVLLPWLDFVMQILVQEIPDQLLGCSSGSMAMKHGVNVSGTIAHEPHMVFAALAFDGTEESIKQSQIKLLTEWVDFYGTEGSVILPDTFGTHNMIKWLPAELVARYKGARIDSKDPMIGIPEIHNWFKNCGCDPFTKAAIPSDGISIQDAVMFQNTFGKDGLIINAPGTILGSNLDLPHLSIVGKVYSANGKYCVKLSDNIAKKMGVLSEEYAMALNYHENYNKVQIV